MAYAYSTTPLLVVETSQLDLAWGDDAIDELALLAEQINATVENIGARRLHTIMSTLLEEIMFNVPDVKSEKVKITKAKVQSTLKEIIEDEGDEEQGED